MKNSKQQILEKFYAISAIPRESGNEARIRKFLVRWAKAHGFKATVDKTGNLLVKTGVSPVILQGHLDMVCEKSSSSKHNFKKDPIKIIENNGWLKADSTSLGADNGVAIAYMMQLAEEGYKLELLFTIDEETGLNGAMHLGKRLLKGKYLINLDSEDEGIFTIGCAAGNDLVATMRAKTIKNNRQYAYQISVRDLPGGHSGADIHKNVPNAIKVLNDKLKELADIRIALINGGSKRNAIPRDAYAVIVTDNKLNLPPAPRPALSLTDAQTRQIIRLLGTLKHGVIKMWDNTIPQTSCNLAMVRSINNKISVTVSCRSFIQKENSASVKRAKQIFISYGFSPKEIPGYPAWEPEPKNSTLIKTAVGCYKKLFKKTPKTLPMHAGLECGVIKSKYPQLQAISLGPNIKNPHSPDEKIEIKSIENTWRLLKELVKNLY
jgi:dipeptidase D